MIRSKATFRAIRQMLGLSHKDVAELLDINEIRNIRRWESPTSQLQPPERAWELLENMHDAFIHDAADQVATIQKLSKTKKPNTIQLKYYINKEDFLAEHPDDYPLFTYANTQSRLVAMSLENLGYDVEFIYGNHDEFSSPE